MKKQAMATSEAKKNVSLDLGAIATNRFGLGAKNNEIKQAKQQPKQWLLAQFEQSPAVVFNHKLATSDKVLSDFGAYQKAKKAFKKQLKSQPKASMLAAENTDSENTVQATMSESEPSQIKTKKSKKNKANNNKPNNPSKAFYRQFSHDTLQSAITSDNSLNWRLLDFFSNHFSVTAQGGLLLGLVGTLEREAIAPHLLGSFEELLIAVTQHPAMLIYLNNEKSVGPDSPFALRAKSKKRLKGLNENLAREILELHTVGVNSGYTQQDVTELAKGITGWSVSRPNAKTSATVTTGFVFKNKQHQPGTRSLLGKDFNEAGIKQGEAMLKYIALHPKTAQHLCTKLATHFIQDTPSSELVNHLARHWQQSKGNIKVVMQALINHPLAWQATPQKYKTPRELMISTYRLLSSEKTKNNKSNKNIPFNKMRHALTNMGQLPFKAGSPAGYGDQQQEWSGGNALMARIEWVSQTLSRFQLDALALQKIALGEAISEHSFTMIKRAESQQQAATLLLLSPEFLRR